MVTFWKIFLKPELWYVLVYSVLNIFLLYKQCTLLYSKQCMIQLVINNFNIIIYELDLVINQREKGLLLYESINIESLIIQ